MDGKPVIQKGSRQSQMGDGESGMSGRLNHLGICVFQNAFGLLESEVET